MRTDPTNIVPLPEGVLFVEEKEISGKIDVQVIPFIILCVCVHDIKTEERIGSDGAPHHHVTNRLDKTDVHGE